MENKTSETLRIVIKETKAWKKRFSSKIKKRFERSE